MSAPNLTEVRGVGAITAAKLEAAGIDSIEKLAGTPTEEVGRITGFHLARAESLVGAATALAGQRAATTETPEAEAAKKDKKKDKGKAAKKDKKKKDKGKAAKKDKKKKDKGRAAKKGKKSSLRLCTCGKGKKLKPEKVCKDLEKKGAKKDKKKKDKGKKK